MHGVRKFRPGGPFGRKNHALRAQFRGAVSRDVSVGLGQEARNARGALGADLGPTDPVGGLGVDHADRRTDALSGDEARGPVPGGSAHAPQRHGRDLRRGGLGHGCGDGRQRNRQA